MKTVLLFALKATLAFAVTLGSAWATTEFINSWLATGLVLFGVGAGVCQALEMTDR